MASGSWYNFLIALIIVHCSRSLVISNSLGDCRDVRDRKKYYFAYVKDYIDCPDSFDDCTSLGNKQAKTSCKTCCFEPTETTKFPGWAIGLVCVAAATLVIIVTLVVRYICVKQAQQQSRNFRGLPVQDTHSPSGGYDAAGL